MKLIKVKLKGWNARTAKSPITKGKNIRYKIGYLDIFQSFVNEWKEFFLNF